MRDLILIAADIRSCHNVGSLLRTAEGLGARVVLTGISPYPEYDGSGSQMPHPDKRMPHEVRRITSKIHKTALGSETAGHWEHEAHAAAAIERLRAEGYRIVALEQANNATALNDYSPGDKVAVILGREVDGVPAELLDIADDHVYIPMFGKKESFNVVHAAAMCLFHLRFA